MPMATAKSALQIGFEILNMVNKIPSLQIPDNKYSDWLIQDIISGCCINANCSISNRLICFDLDQKIDDLTIDLSGKMDTRSKCRTLKSLSKLVNQQMTFEESEKILHLVEFIAAHSHTGSLKHKSVALDLIINTCVVKCIEYFPHLDTKWLVGLIPHTVIKYIFPRACNNDGEALCLQLIKKERNEKIFSNII